ncbi:hypothetical protein C8R46DRAFT_254455 [Mycena filopes]|nr:hypothetical protein C8R46DRAFT_254455 [Mycena filopes]
MSTAALRRRLVELDSKIIEQTQLLVALERDRAAVHKELLDTAKFPVLTLPVELTAEIFSHCLPPLERLRMPIEATPPLRQFAPMMFLAICRSWRQIALGTPGLWKTLSLHLYPLDRSQPGEAERFAAEWLGRATGYPLSIVCYTSPDDTPFPTSLLRDIIQRYANKLEYLDIYSSQDDVRQLELESIAFPILQRAVIGDAYVDTDLEDLVPIFSNAPRLSNLEFSCDTLFSAYTFPSLQLTKFEGAITTLEIFAISPNLLEVKCAMTGQLPETTSITVHDRLVSLSVVAPEMGHSTDMFPYLTLPALRSLHILDSDVLDLRSISSFLVRSAPPLKQLSLDVEEVETHRDINRCLIHVAGTLEDLEFISVCHYALVGMLERLHLPHTYKKPHRYSLPHLRTLTLTDSPMVSYTDILQFLQRRSSQPDVAKLRSFRLTASDGTFPEDEVRLQGHYQKVLDHFGALTSQGMEIYIGTEKQNYIRRQS